MKYIVYVILSYMLSGCTTLAVTSLVADYLGDSNKLDTAPKERLDVMYPDWGEVPKETQYVTSKDNGMSSGQMKATRASGGTTIGALTQFLSLQQIDYEVLPGNFPIVRIKRPITFDVGSDDISYRSRAWIYKLSDYLAKTKSIEVVVDGHADATGAENQNDKLSKRRADAVKALLADAPNVSVNSIYTRGYADLVPACSNVSRYGRSCNRRVELFFIITA